MVKNILLLGIVLVFAVQFGLIDLRDVRDDLVNWTGSKNSTLTGPSGSDWG